VLSRTNPEPSGRRQKLPHQRWQIAPLQAEQAAKLAQATGLSPLLSQVLINRGFQTPQAAQVFLNPETQAMPAPLDEFPDLGISVEMLQEAIANQDKIAICGDYDADGMTSTALLLRALRWLGAEVDYAIPSRMKDGYGINTRIVDELAEAGFSLILTVDNGISAHAAIARAVELGITIIITDHHDLPPELPEADAILNPKQLDESSPLSGIGGCRSRLYFSRYSRPRIGSNSGLNQATIRTIYAGNDCRFSPLNRN
jgi:single-stranded-DNA-specific exonuclease